MTQPAQPIEYNLKAYMPVLATAYGEGANQDFNTKVEILSTILNRAESGREEFGAHTGKLTDVLQRGYYAYSKQSPKFTEAMDQKFPDKVSENSFKEVVAAFSGLMNGKIKRTDSLFFLTNKEIARVKKTKAMNMDALEKTGGNDTWTFFKYAAKPKQTKGRKLAK